MPYPDTILGLVVAWIILLKRMANHNLDILEKVWLSPKCLWTATCPIDWCCREKAYQWTMTTRRLVAAFYRELYGGEPRAKDWQAMFSAAKTRPESQKLRCYFCYAAVGELHERNCADEPCPGCGDLQIDCGCFVNAPDAIRVPWSGLDHDMQVCVRLGWWSKEDPDEELSFIPCSADDPGATPDIGRQCEDPDVAWDQKQQCFVRLSDLPDGTATWHPDQKRWVVEDPAVMAAKASDDDDDEDDEEDFDDEHD